MTTIDPVAQATSVQTAAPTTQVPATFLAAPVQTAAPAAPPVPSVVETEMTGELITIAFRGETISCHTSRVDHYASIRALAAGNPEPMLARIVPDEATRKRLVATTAGPDGEPTFTGMLTMVNDLMEAFGWGK
ncbi:MAG: hypothetical protein Q3999_05080 [Buchananella hordeovulneris]|nr:hypothetical protein [Buchananella hordeovulneris]